MKCKHAIISGGDFLPYGSTSVQLPEYVECDNPYVPDYLMDVWACDETCPYYEAEDEDTK